MRRRPDRPPHGSMSTAPWQRHERWTWVVLQRQHVLNGAGSGTSLLAMGAVPRSKSRKREMLRTTSCKAIQWDITTTRCRKFGELELQGHRISPRAGGGLVSPRVGGGRLSRDRIPYPVNRGHTKGTLHSKGAPHPDVWEGNDIGVGIGGRPRAGCLVPWDNMTAR